MNINETEIMICDCGKTMPLDAKKIGSGCNSEDDPKIFTALCTDQINYFEEALSTSSNNKKTLSIACTQQAKLFSDIAEENNHESPYFFNIRETAGWSKTSQKASAKISSLILDASRMANSNQTSKSLSFNSAGRCLVYGKSEAVLEVAEGLSEFLGVSALITDTDDIIPPKNSNFNILSGEIVNLNGYFCNFEVKINNFSEALPHSKEEIVFGQTSQDISSECDIFIDLSGNEPLIQSHEKRDGYYKVDPNDKIALYKTINDAQSKIGEFEKPIYVNFDENLCAHSRNKIVGCSKCLEVCPANAIQPNGDTVSIDTAICGGCGMCGSVCPSGAAQVVWPSMDNLLNRLSYISNDYKSIENKMPKLLIHDEKHGNGILSYLSRVYDGLPHDVIPIEVHSIGRAGHDLLVGATTLGFSEIFILSNPDNSSENLLLYDQVKIANALVKDIIKQDEKFIILETNDPEVLSNKLSTFQSPKEFSPSPFIATGSNKSIIRTAMKGLAKENNFKEEVIDLPLGSPYGSVKIDSEGCTLCLSCVSACPAGALQDNPETPQLLFREDACIQCGICVKTCPEKVISLLPQFNLSDNALSNELRVEDEPFPCKICGKIFGTKKSIESIKHRLSSHSMFSTDGRLDLILMCEDCRVEDQFKQDDKVIDVEDRPKPRTTDDYN